MIALLLALLLPWSDDVLQFGSFGETKQERLFQHKQVKHTNNERYRPPLKELNP